MIDQEIRNQENAPEKKKSQGNFSSLKPDLSNHSSMESGEQLSGGNQIPEITTNDGSVIETLDTALHGTPGWSDGENLSGSNRADYYEARSYGKSDSEEEQDEMRERNKNEADRKSV
jgi:hypothetical protein